MYIYTHYVICVYINTDKHLPKGGGKKLGACEHERGSSPRRREKASKPRSYLQALDVEARIRNRSCKPPGGRGGG